MDVSLKFKFIEDYLTKLFFAIVQNKNIAKYVYYNKSNDPISMPTVTADLLGEGYYYLNFFDEKIAEDEKIRLFLNVIGSPLNEPMDNITFLLEVVMPEKCYILSGRGEIRGMRILDEVARLIDQKLGIGIGEAKVKNLRVSRVPNSDYNVVSINIIIKSPNIKGQR